MLPPPRFDSICSEQGQEDPPPHGSHSWEVLLLAGPHPERSELCRASCALAFQFSWWLNMHPFVLLFCSEDAAAVCVIMFIASRS